MRNFTCIDNEKFKSQVKIEENRVHGKFEIWMVDGHPEPCCFGFATYDGQIDFACGMRICNETTMNEFFSILKEIVKWSVEAMKD